METYFTPGGGGISGKANAPIPSVVRAKKSQKHPANNMKKRDRDEKRYVVYLTCVLRLRCVPAVPYSSIANILLTALPDNMKHFALKRAVCETRAYLVREIERMGVWGLKPWLTEYAEELSHRAGAGWSQTYRDAQKVAPEIVEGILTNAGLHQHTVVDDTEAALQAKWKAEGDWRTGSTPESRPRDSDLRWITVNDPPRLAPSSFTCWRRNFDAAVKYGLVDVSLDMTHPIQPDSFRTAIPSPTPVSSEESQMNLIVAPQPQAMKHKLTFKDWENSEPFVPQQKTPWSY
ncbi:hypothetical protein B0O99DRAFT_680373 [Bisporella sp. PMI_857]|nr:hypothetical protein B0O99DRAFT_680373 [Bisporella sp. PMI_857]